MPTAKGSLFYALLVAAPVTALTTGAIAIACQSQVKCRGICIMSPYSTNCPSRITVTPDLDIGREQVKLKELANGYSDRPIIFVLETLGEFEHEVIDNGGTVSVGGTVSGAFGPAGGSGSGGAASSFGGLKGKPKDPPGRSGGPILKSSVGGRSWGLGGAGSIDITVSRGGYSSQEGYSEKAGVMGIPVGGGLRAGISISWKDGKLSSITFKLGDGINFEYGGQMTCTDQCPP